MFHGLGFFLLDLYWLQMGLKRVIYKCLLFLSFNCMHNLSHSQTWQWFSSAGGDKSDKGTDIDIDNDGNLYVSGYYNTSSSGNVMFSTITATANFGKEAFVAKIDNSGNWQWVTTGIGGWDERALGICVDKINRFVYTTGTCWYKMNTFGSCVPSASVFPGSGDNIFIAKTDFNGNCQWIIGAGTGSDDHGYDLVTDKAGNLYVTGFVSPSTAQADFGIYNVPVSMTDSLGWVAKLSPSGNFKWIKTFHGIDGERDNRIAIDDSANVYLTGGFYGIKAYDTNTLTSNGDFDVFVLKYDSAGNQKWARSAGGPLGDRGNSITVDDKQNVYVTGEFRDVVAFGTDTVDNYGGPGGRDIFVSKITKNGNWVWASKAGSSNGSDRGNRIVSNKKDLLYVTGQIKGSAKFGTINAICNPMDSVQVFVAAIDTSGVWSWVMQGGGHKEDRGAGIAVDPECNVFVTGYYQDTACFGAACDTSLNRKDIFVTRIASECNIAGIGIKEYDDFGSAVLFPNPSADKFVISLGRSYSNLTVSVYNVIGQELQNKKLRALNSIEIDPGNSSGIYFIRLTSPEGLSKTFKAIKE